MSKSFFAVDKLNVVAKECFSLVRFNFDNNDYLIYYSKVDNDLCEIFVSKLVKERNIFNITDDPIIEDTDFGTLIHKIVELPSLYTNKDDINNFISDFCLSNGIMFNDKIPNLADQELKKETAIIKVAVDYVKYVEYFYKNSLSGFKNYPLKHEEKSTVEVQPTDNISTNNNSVWSIPSDNKEGPLQSSLANINESVGEPVEMPINADYFNVQNYFGTNTNANLNSQMQNQTSNNLIPNYNYNSSYPNSTIFNNSNYVNNGVNSVPNYGVNQSNNNGFVNSTGTYTYNPSAVAAIYGNNSVNSSTYFNNESANPYYVQGTNLEYQNSGYQQNFNSNLVSSNAGFATNKYIIIGTVCLILASAIVAISIVLVDKL